MQVQIRFATIQDTKEILQVYKSNNTKVSMMHTRTPIPSLQELQQQITEISAEYPFLVCTADDRIVGYCYACPGVADATIDRDVELYAATHRDCRACGVATALCTAVICLLKMQNVQRVFSKIQAPNPRGEQLLIHFHFALSQHFYSEVCMCGQQHDVLWFDKWLSGFTKYPPALRKIFELTPEECAQAFQEGLSCIDTDDLEFCL